MVYGSVLVMRRFSLILKEVTQCFPTGAFQKTNVFVVGPDEADLDARSVMTVVDNLFEVEGLKWGTIGRILVPLAFRLLIRAARLRA